MSGMRLIHPRVLAFGDDRAGSDAESGAEAEVINRAARRSGAVFRRVTPWRVRIDPRADDDGGAGRVGATTSENQSRATRVHRTRAGDDETRKIIGAATLFLGEARKAVTLTSEPTEMLKKFLGKSGRRILRVSRYPSTDR